MLDIFKKWLDFRNVKFENFDNEPNEKIVFKFKDADLHKEWVGFYSVYMNGVKEGKQLMLIRLAAFASEQSKDVK